MKIAYICLSYPPMVSGAAIAVQLLAEGISAKGHQILVIAASDKAWPYREEISPGFTVARIKSFDNPYRIDQRISLPWAEEFYAELEKFQPDIIHVQSVVFLRTAKKYKSRVAKILIVVTLHQLPWFVSAHAPQSERLRKWIEDFLYKFGLEWMEGADEIIVASQIVARTVQDQWKIPSKVISNGVDLQVFSPQKNSPEESDLLVHAYKLDPKLPIIIHVGRLDVDKQTEMVVEAAAPILRAGEAQLLMVGNGRVRKRLINLCEKLNISDQTHFPGFVWANNDDKPGRVLPKGDLPGLYRLANVFVTASEIETQGIVVLEAAASGLPVVAFNATSLPELIQDGKTGYLLPKGEVSLLSDRIRDLLSSPKNAKEFGKQARKFIENNHSIKQSFAQVEQVYRSLHS